MRIIFIHGFGETESIFNKIAPFITGKQLFINVWETIGNVPRKDINVLIFAKELVEKYNITKKDVIIGHSMGGWIAYHIKHITESPAVQIASWSDPDRPYKPINNAKVSYWLVRRGLVFNNFIKRIMVFKFYKNLPSKEIYQETYNRLMQSNKENVINQLRLILEPVPEKLTIQPDLRIHAGAKSDKVVRKPREAFHEVMGDHFTLHTNPETVFEPIVAFLKTL